VKAVAGYPLPSYSIREEAGESILRIQGEGAAAWAYRELPVPIDLPINSRKGTLGWSWRVLESPEGADLRVPERDDAPLRVYVVFGKPSGLSMRRARVIFYSWGNAEPAGWTMPSFSSENFQIVRVAGARDVGREWREQAVNPFADYRKFWGGEPPPIHAVGVMQDTDMTGAAAVSELRSLEWFGP